MNEQVFINENGHEYLKHGTNDFPIAFYHTENTGFPLHFHDEFELIHVIDGTLLITVANKQYHLNKNEAILVNSSIPHELLKNTSYQEQDVVFDPIFLSSNTTILYTKYVYPFLFSNVTCVIFKENEHTLSTIKHLFEINKTKNDLYEFAVRNSLSEIFMDAFSKVNDNITKESSSASFENIKKALSYIKNNYQNEISLSDIATQMHVSKRETERLFKQYLGTSPYKCILQERLAQAAMYLTNSTETITEICYKCGFKDTSSFTNQFKKCYGKTPRQYRNSTN